MIDNTDKLKLVSLALNCRDFVPVKGVRNKKTSSLFAWIFFLTHERISIIITKI